MEGNQSVEAEPLVEAFRGIASCTREEALFFLESHNYVLDAALHSYYDSISSDDNNNINNHREREEHGREEEEEGEQQQQQQEEEDIISLPRRLSARSVGAMSSGSGSGDKKPSRPSGSRPAIHTLADLNRRPGPGSDDDSDEPQEYYTGGEKSGMLVQDPSKGNHDVDAIFEQARQMGAMQGPFENQPSSSSRSFTGTGRLLSGETVPSTPQQPENLVHNIYFWSNGFTVNDGPLRRFDDPENAPFLESIMKSECPKELEPADRRTAVHVNLIRREEKCPEPVKRHTSFQGTGRTLGGESSSGPEAPEPAASTADPSSVPSPAAGLYVDASLPSTSIQLRLADGTRMVARFNHHHTVGDIRAFIDASRPGAARTYRLQTVGFPPKQLTDVTQTIEQAGLANSVVIQKL